VIDDHKIKNLLEKGQSNIADILLLLKEEDTLDQEKKILSGRKRLKVGSEVQNTKSADPWHNFYSRLKQVKNYHSEFGTTNYTYVHTTPDNLIDNVFKPPFRERKKIITFSSIFGRRRRWQIR
jgi:hypothetical protein